MRSLQIISCKRKNVRLKYHTLLKITNMQRSRSYGIKPRDEPEEELSSNAAFSDYQSEHGSDFEDQPGDDDSQSSLKSDKDVEDGPVKEISFGALVEAQARFNSNPRKRKLAERDDSPDDDDESKYDRAAGGRGPPEQRTQKQSLNRSSKHAPTVLSSRNPVTRRRDIFSPPPSEKFRDPRFDSAVTAESRRGNTSSTHGASRNYAFLNEYQAAEVLDLKSQLKKSKDSSQQAELKRKIMSVEAKLRNAELSRREAEIMHEHKRKEREAIKAGKKSKPYFLKQSEIRKQINQERQEAMGKRARDKSEKRKKKREKTKDARDMPRVRRHME